MLSVIWGRYTVWLCTALISLASLVGAIIFHSFFWILAVVAAGLFLLGCVDYMQKRRGVIANYPLLGRMRYLLESIRPELRQYFWEADTDELPYSRNQRAMVYQRAKGILAARPLGTVLDIYREDYNWLNHSMVPSHIENKDFRVCVGEGDHAYDCAILNISGTSFGAMSPPAIQALNSGARLGGFAHNTGEGAFSKYHAAGGGDVIWQISTGYFGCRTADGRFDADIFAKTASQLQIKMIEIKLSQGAKPGHGGMLLAPKVTPEIAETRGIKSYEDCISPPRHSEFSTPRGLLEFADRLRQLSGGKPVGIKLCIGHPWEFAAIVKAMVETDIAVDFITVDGSEGGTGAAPVEFTDHLGCPLRDALVYVDNALKGAGLRQRVKIAASGKIVSAYDVVRHIALGADWCNMARPFMFALGCIQARDCASGNCPTGLATMNPHRYRVVDVDERAKRVANFQHHTIEAVAEMLEAAGLDGPHQLSRRHIVRRLSASQIQLADQIYPKVADGALLRGESVEDPRLASYWYRVTPDSFAPVEPK
ncbi:MAG: FMN-binding glutamate synthase family protein [Candidatus Puniceispirillaceae bacterium]